MSEAKILYMCKHIEHGLARGASNLLVAEMAGGGGGMERRYRDRDFWRQNTADVDAYNEYLIICKDKDKDTKVCFKTCE